MVSQREKANLKSLYVILAICLGLLVIAKVGDYFWGDNVGEQLDRLEKEIDQMELKVDRLQDKLQQRPEESP